MSSHLIRVPEAVYARLQSLAEESGTPMGAVVQHLVEQEEERRYWARFDADYAALRADPAADAAERQERAFWDTALMDGLADYPYEDERLTPPTDAHAE
jgi:predicted transcriptional regulator